MGREEDGCGKLRNELIRQVEVDVEAAQVTLFLVIDLLDLKLRKDLPAGGLFNMGQWQETGRQQSFGAYFLRSEVSERFPAGSARKLHAHPALHRFSAARHHSARQCVVGKVVPLVQQIPLSLKN